MKPFDDITYIYFFIKDDQFLKNTMKTKIKSKTVLKTDLIESLHKRKSIKTKIKSFNNRIIPIMMVIKLQKKIFSILFYP